MTQPEQTLEEAILAALLDHADAAHLQLTNTQVRAQAAVAVRAAQTWTALGATRPRRPHPPKPVPPADQPAPAHPTPARAHCCRPDCGDAPYVVGWRWYLADGWQPACARHMIGAPTAGRRYNSEYAAVTR